MYICTFLYILHYIHLIQIEKKNTVKVFAGTTNPHEVSALYRVATTAVS